MNDGVITKYIDCFGEKRRFCRKILSHMSHLNNCTIINVTCLEREKFSDQSLKLD